MQSTRLIVGLGNPGSEYSQTRHNAGFILVDRLVSELDSPWGFERKFNAKIAKLNLGGQKVVCCEPYTYMNLSGEAVVAVVKYYQIALVDLLVVVDDADLPLGEIRLRPSGGSAGHHGLDSIMHHLESRDYARLRVGIGRKNEARQIAGHVLGKFSADEQEIFERVATRAVSQIKCWIGEGLQKAMNQFNGAISSNNEEK